MTQRRVLLVDDDEDIREVAQATLEAVGGWHVSAVGSAPEGLAAAQADRPDVILLDLMMPGMDGKAMLEALRADPATATIPVVLLTAKSSGGTPLPDGAAGVLAKPFDPLRLARDVAAVLGW